MIPVAAESSSSTLGPPAFLLVEITSRCNLRCGMCPLTTQETPSSQHPGHMTESLWQSLLPFARETGRVNIGGYGEPLLNPRWFAYLQDLDRAGVYTTLTTNGTIVTARFAEQLKTLARLETVVVSIDSPDPRIYHHIRGGSLEKALDGVRHLTSALRPSQVTVTSVMMRTNLDSLPAFPPLLARLNATKYVVQGLIDYATGLDDEELRWRNGLPSRVAQLAEAARQAGVAIEFTLPQRVASELREPADVAETVAAHLAASASEAEGAKQCFAPWDAPVIDKDGRVFPCCYALTHASAMLGDLNESRAEDVWRGERFQQFRRDIVNARTTPSVCRRCTVVPTGPHVLGLYAARMVHHQSVLGDSREMCLVVQNVGTATWTSADRILIGTASPRDGASAFYDPSWIGTNRITSFVERAVPPGGVATFRFRVTRVPHPISETFQLVVEDKCWLPAPRFSIQHQGGQPEISPRWRGLRQAVGDLLRRNRH